MTTPARPSPRCCDACDHAEAERNRLRPPDGSVWVVRWIRRDGRDAVHRFYMRRHAALARADLLRSWGRTVVVYESSVTWKEAGQ